MYNSVLIKLLTGSEFFSITADEVLADVSESLGKLFGKREQDFWIPLLNLKDVTSSMLQKLTKVV